MKVKDLHGEWKQANLSIQISVEGLHKEEVNDITKMLEDFVSTTLVNRTSLVLTSVDTRIQSMPYPLAKKIITYTKVR